MKKLELFVNCRCSTPEHILRFFVFANEPSEVYASVYLNQMLPWHRRVWAAIKYIFGASKGYGNFEESLIDNSDAQSLVKFLNNFNSLNEVYSTKPDNSNLTDDEVNKILES